MKQQLLSKAAKQKLAAVIISVLLLSLSVTGCGDSNIAGTNDPEHKISGSGESQPLEKMIASGIKLDLNLMFGKNNIKESRMLESNTGNQFNHIIYIDRDLKPGDEIDLQELQPFGIFGLYLCGTDEFALTNSDGMSLGSKTILLERCSFIDLKLENHSAGMIHVTGFIAGE